MPFGHAFPRLLRICRRYLTSCSSPESEFPHVVQGLLKSTQRHTAANRLGVFHATFAIECCLARVVIDSNVDRALLPVIAHVLVSLSQGLVPGDFKSRIFVNRERSETSFTLAQVCCSDCCFFALCIEFVSLRFLFLPFLIDRTLKIVESRQAFRT